MRRDTALDQLRSRDEPWDLLIIGGGATGLGAAVDAATRGHSVALIERADFAKGTSSRSTKLVHGGVRYLKQGNISLVMEALRDKAAYGNLKHDQRHDGQCDEGHEELLRVALGYRAQERGESEAFVA